MLNNVRKASDSVRQVAEIILIHNIILQIDIHCQSVTEKRQTSCQTNCRNNIDK